MIFANSPHYIKDKPFDPFDNGKTYYPISPFGDGNCGLYAFACGLIDSIINNKLTLDEKKFSEFRDVIRVCLDLGSINVSEFKHELEVELFKFMEFFFQHDLTFSQFKDFLVEQPLTRDRLAAINLILGQGLRLIGVASYIETCEEEMGIKPEDLLEEEIQLFRTGEWIGQQILGPLANYFGIQLKLISKNPYTNKYYHSDSLSQDSQAETPAFNLLFKGDHWHYLVPREQKLGLATLPSANKERRISRELLDSNKKIMLEVKNDKQKSLDFAKAALENLATRLKQVFDSLVALKDIFNNAPSKTETFKKANKQANKQAKIVARDSSLIIDAWRKKWDVSNDQLDTHLNTLGLHHELEKALIKEPLVTDDSDDPAIADNAAAAAILQNADIADFLSRNYASLKKFNRSTSENNFDSHIITNRNQFVTVRDLKNVAPCISQSL
ncbi:hypothetical protein [Rickettsiella endosymbiont of Dermanyssus gallinae]|uniref:hypothetical protein n=1 Tax=Rickettsiella endosymbiont of Dermanyssus gallinae TaxID=2856608 RepID=UPI001C52E4B4|nr:hypothetical protein [Rickettsiella endosymbiont of Dermanyssus gallinae]